MRRADLTIGIAAAVLAVIAVTPALGHDRKHVARPGHPSGHNDDHKPGHDNAHDNKVRAAKIEQLYQLLLKAPLVIAGQESVDHIFDASVEGRVTPVGKFHDREGVNEYFFGLAATPTSQVVAVDIKSLAASGNKVVVEVDITFAPPLAQRSQTLRQTGFFTFNRKNRVVSFDLAILNLGAAVNPTSEAERQANMQAVCALLTVGFPPSPHFPASPQPARGPSPTSSPASGS